MTEEKKKFLEVFFRKLGLIISTCDECGVEKSQFDQWLKDDKEFSKQVETVDDRRREFVQAAFFGEMQNGNLKAIEIGMSKFGVKGWEDTIPPSSKKPIKERKLLNAKK